MKSLYNPLSQLILLLIVVSINCIGITNLQAQDCLNDYQNINLPMSVCSEDIELAITDWQTSFETVNANVTLDNSGSELFLNFLYSLEYVTETCNDDPEPLDIGFIQWNGGSECTPSSISIYAYIGCTLSGPSSCSGMGEDEYYYHVGILDLTIYPPPAPPTVIRLNDNCDYFIDYACSGDVETGTNVAISLTPGDPGGVTNVQITTSNGCTEVLSVNKEACPANSTCPTGPIMIPAVTSACSEASMLINGDFGQAGSLTGDIEVTVNPPVAIPSGGVFSLTSATNYDRTVQFPPNTGCEPVVYTFAGTANCSDGTIIPPNRGSDLLFTVTVYPDFNSDFINIIAGDCNNAGTVSAACGNYDLTPNTGPTNPQPGQSGNDSWEISYNDGTGNSNCFATELVAVPYNCNPNCPSQPGLQTFTSVICSGGSAEINVDFAIPAGSSGTFDISETSGTFGNVVINNGDFLTYNFPQNTGCDPVVYTFTATAYCIDGSIVPGNTSNLTTTITVYPEFNPDLINIFEGSCGVAASATSACDNYFIASAGNPPIPGPGDSGTHPWEVIYDDFNSPFCFSEIIEVDYNCNPDCPSVPFIEINDDRVCSGSTVTITGVFGTNGIGTAGTFTITETSGVINNIFNGSSFSLPINNGCEPILYTFVAEATCSDGSIIAGTIEDMTVTVTVYPEYNPDLLVAEQGSCDNPTLLNSTCANYLVIGNDYQASPGEVGSYSYNVVYNDPLAPNCFGSPAYDVDYACSDACPSDPTITVSLTEACSGDQITINTSFGQTGGLDGTFIITETSGLITGITPNNPFVLPINTGCDPITYTFIGEAICDDSSPIFGANLTTTITVFPEFNPDLIQISEGFCGTTGSITNSCPNYDINPANNPTNPQPGDAGIDVWEVSYVGGDCFGNQIIEVPYACSDACPSNPSITASIQAVCSGGNASITGAFGNTGSLTGAFTITESTGAISVTDGNSFTLPTNNGCEPITYTFTATATCSDNTPIFGANMTTTITVYPDFNPNFLISTNGVCGIAGNLTTSCNNYTLIPPFNLTLPQPGDNGNDAWTVDYSYGTPAPNVPCFEGVTFNVPYACNNECPSQPSITATVQSVCSGGNATITGTFGDPGTGSLTGFFVIAELTGTIPSIVDGQTFTLPVNTTCDPITYSFVATAKCSDVDQTPIFGTDMTTTITVFPEFNPDFVTTVGGVCGTAGFLQTSCANYQLSEPNGGATLPVAGQSGSDTWTIDYNYGNFSNPPSTCFAAQEINVVYACNDNCPADPELGVDINEVCSGGSVTFRTVFNTTGTISGTFTITEATGAITGIAEGTPISLPINNGCDPINYIFTAQATCADDNNTPIFGSNLTQTVIVYPEFNAGLLNIVQGSCDNAGEAQTTCPNYLLTPPANPTIPNSGDTGMDTWTISYNGAPNSGACFANESLEVAYSCNEGCPTQPSIRVDNAVVCSGGNIDVIGIFGNTGGGLSGVFNITDPSGAIGGISGMASDTPTSITLPTNDGCEPVTYSLTAEAICEDDSIIPGSISNMTATVTVYPDFNASLINTTEGDCENPGTATSSCAFYLISGNPTLPAAGEVGSDQLIINYNYQGTIPSEGVCFEDALIEVAYSCQASCPSQPKIFADVTNLCSGGTAKIDGVFGLQGSEGGTITIEETGGEIVNIINGQPFTLPTNDACEPKTYTFTARAVCDDETDIPGNATDLTLQINVYPEFNLEFINIDNGECGEAGTATSICDFYELDPRSATVPGAGEAGRDTWDIYYNDPNAPNCFAGEVFEVPYNCGAACPSSPVININQEEVCSGANITITGFFEQVGTGSLDGDFTITEAGGSITNILNGVSFNLPTNNGCDPVSYTFIATATCEDNSVINPNNPEDMTVTVRVYPVFNEAFVEITPGVCGEVGSAEALCPNYDIVPTGTPTVPGSGEAGEDIWSVSYLDAPVNCLSIQNIEVPYNCGVACPSAPFLQSNASQICSGGTIVLTADFREKPPQSSGNFTIIETSGAISNIQNGVTITLPENTGCEPIIYTFSAAASCSGNPIAADNPSDVLINVTVYPDFNEDLVRPNPGICGEAGTLDVICTNYEVVRPANLIIPEAGESGSQVWTVNYIGEFACFSEQAVNVPYACDVSCPTAPRISTDLTTVCSGGFLRISGAFGQQSNILADFEISETTGTLNNITNGVSFQVPENIGCDPVTYTFTAKAFCNGQEIDADNQDMTVNVSVFPEFNENFITITNGACSGPGEVETTCNKYELEALTRTFPFEGESGTDTWFVNYQNSSCIINQPIQVPYNCGVSCPSEPRISTGNQFVCGLESISINGFFDNIGDGQGGYFKITELSGKISNIQNGITFTIPPNNQCDPISYTFTAEAFCDDNTPVLGSATDLTLTVISYPEFNEDFINIESGNCDQVGVATSICENYILTAQSQTLAASGESGSDKWDVVYVRDENNFACFRTSTIDVPYNCGQSCPSIPVIELAGGSTAVCGGSSVVINGFFRNVSDLTGSFEISETSNTIQDIESGIAFQLPENKGCNPQTYTFVAAAACVDGTNITGNATDLTLSITVYPAFNPELIQINPGTCENTGSIQKLCDNYEIEALDTPTLPDEGQSGRDTWLINYKAPNESGFGCFANEEVSVAYGCGVACPSGPRIEADNNNICSGNKARITGFTEQIGEGTAATFRITDTKGEIVDIENGQPFDLPINTGCEAVSYTFTATALCSDGNVIEGNASDLTVNIIVYPEFNEDLIIKVPGACGKEGNAISSCPNYELTAESQTLPFEGESGADIWKVQYKGDFDCWGTANIEVPYNCGVSCPENPRLTASQTVLCSGERLTLSGDFETAGGEGTSGAFTLREIGNLITNITIGETLDLPANNSCDPDVYTFIATATCTDGTEIVGDAQNMTVTITVYPDFNDNLLSKVQGDCDGPGQITTTCDKYNLVGPTNPVIPQEGESGTDIWLVNYSDGADDACFNEVQVSLPYSCNVNCPTSPRLLADVLEVCSGQPIVFDGVFDVSSPDVLRGTFNIVELSGVIPNIAVGQEVFMPVNNSCDPKRYTFQATATCENGQEIIGISNDLQLVVTVYPTYNPSLIAIQKGNCDRVGRAVATCDNYAVRPLGDLIIPEEGTSGFDQWEVNYNGGQPEGQVCIEPVIIDIPYSCGSDCPQDPTLIAELSGDSDVFGNLLEVCGGQSVVFRTSFGIQGDLLSGSFAIDPDNSEFSNVIPDIPVLMPDNDSCDPIDYAFVVTGICDNGSIIEGSEERAKVIVRVYPNVIDLNLVEVTEGNCGSEGVLTTSCDNYSVLPPLEPTLPEPGDNGLDLWGVIYSGKRPVSGRCVDNAKVEVPYICIASCPVDPIISTNSLSACSGEEVTITGAFKDGSGGGLGANFEIKLLSDNTLIEADTPFTLPENNTCDPVVLTYVARVFCGNGEEIFGEQDDLTTKITVYPKPSSPELINSPSGCGLQVSTDCPDLIIEYLNQDELTWSTTLENVVPQNGDSVTWRASHRDAGNTCQASGVAVAADCPEIENGCPYPVIYAKRRTLNSSTPSSTSSETGPVILFCRLPVSLQAVNFDLSKVKYEWGFYNEDFSLFIIPGKGSYNPSNWQFTANTAIGNPSNVNESFYVVNPDDGASSLRHYGALVTNDLCPANRVITWNGKTAEEQALLPYDFMQIFPNPNDGQFSLTLYNAQTNGMLDVRLYNQMGQVIYRFQADKTESMYHLSLMMDDLDAGVYFVEATLNGKKRYIEKLIKY